MHILCYEKRNNMRIHICDCVTVNDNSAPKDTFMTISGALEIGKFQDIEGMWEVMDNKENRYKTFGCFITVWKPIPPTKK